MPKPPEGGEGRSYREAQESRGGGAELKVRRASRGCDVHRASRGRHGDCCSGEC